MRNRSYLLDSPFRARQGKTNENTPPPLSKLPPEWKMVCNPIGFNFCTAPQVSPDEQPRSESCVQIRVKNRSVLEYAKVSRVKPEEKQLVNPHLRVTLPTLPPLFRPSGSSPITTLGGYKTFQVAIPEDSYNSIPFQMVQTPLNFSNCLGMRLALVPPSPLGGYGKPYKPVNRGVKVLNRKLVAMGT